MKLALTIAGALVMFAVATMALRRTVGGLVDQAGAREVQRIGLTVRLSLADRAGHPIGGAPIRLLLGADPPRQPPSAGDHLKTEADGTASIVVKTTLNKAQRNRRTDLVSSLFKASELTDHLTVGLGIDDPSDRTLYVMDFHRFPNGDVVRDGPRLYTRDEQGRYARKPELDGDVREAADAGPMGMTSVGYDVRLNSFEPTRDPTAWTLSMSLIRPPGPVVK